MIISITEKGEALKEKAVNIPGEMTSKWEDLPAFLCWTKKHTGHVCMCGTCGQGRLTIHLI